MKKLAFIYFLALSVFCTATAQKHYTVVISLDGFRWDYTEWYDTPFMDMMADKGVKSALIPSYPSKTFPNHYSIVTGLYPDHHGIVANSFLDRTTGESFSLGNPEQKINPVYYGGEPVWVTAQKQGLSTAVFYWPGSDVRIGGQYPNTYYMYDRKPRLTIEERLNGVIGQLSLPESQRPDLIMAYYEQPDSYGHEYGPFSKKTRSVIGHIDSLLTDFHAKLVKLPIADRVNLIVLADHGMSWVGAGNSVKIASRLRPEWIEKIDGNLPANIYCRDGFADSVVNALQGLDHARVWKKENVPARLNYGTNQRVGEVIVDPDLGYIIDERDLPGGGMHGFDPACLDMHALFRAMGPDFKHVEIPHFRNVDIYPLLCRLLGIKPADNDGCVEEIAEILK